MRESKIQKEVLKYLEQKMFNGECVVARVNAGMLPLARGGFARGAVSGFPDIVLLLNGQFYGLELKNKKGKLSSDQKRMRKWITDSNGIFKVIRSLNDVKEIVE